MRKALELRQEILRLRDQNRMPYSVLAERARISYEDIMNMIALRGTEAPMRKLDAFLDVPELHKVEYRQTKLLLQIQKLSYEVWTVFHMRTMHPEFLATLPVAKQKVIRDRITWQAKTALQKKFHEEHGLNVRAADGQSYWQFKRTCLHKLQGQKAVRSRNGNARRVPWPRPVREEQPL